MLAHSAFFPPTDMTGNFNITCMSRVYLTNNLHDVGWNCHSRLFHNEALGPLRYNGWAAVKPVWEIGPAAGRQMASAEWQMASIYTPGKILVKNVVICSEMDSTRGSKFWCHPSGWIVMLHLPQSSSFNHLFCIAKLRCSHCVVGLTAHNTGVQTQCHYQVLKNLAKDKSSFTLC